MRFFCLALIMVCGDCYAFSWADLWFTKDQQAQELMKKKQFKQAETLFTHENWRAAAAYRAGEYKLAAQQYESLQNEQGFYNQGNALAHLGQYENAIKAYNQALAINPKNEDAIFNRKLLEDLLKKNNQQGQNQQDKNQQGQNQQDKNQQGQNQQDKNQQGQNQQDKNQQGQNQQDKNQQGQNQQDKNQQGQNQQDKNQQGQDQQDKNQQGQNQQDKNQQGQNQQDKNQQSQNQEDKDPQNKENANSTQPKAQSADELEKQQAKEQWLRLIPDDPGGLMREKFLRDHLRREGGWY